MNISLRLYKGIVHIPTSYIVERNGFFFEGTPLDSVPVEQTEKLRQAILAAMGRDNPPISRAEVGAALSDSKNSAMLAATRARSWSVLDRQTQGLWSIVDRSGFYEIRVKEPMAPRGWHEDKTKRVQFPSGTSVDEVIERLIAMIQERARE
jgi:hypothetical protein